MSAEQSVTFWINQLKDGDAVAAQQLWQFYFSNMVSVARRRLHGASKRVADEEDVALSAFNSFCMGLQAGRFDIADRDNLWPLLVTITARKVVDLIRHENRVKRGGTGQATAPESDRVMQVRLDEVFSREPSPEFAAQIAEQFELLMRRLDSADDPHMHEVALLKMEGMKNEEVASRLSCTKRTVERKIRIIASIWNREVDL